MRRSCERLIQAVMAHLMVILTSDGLAGLVSLLSCVRPVCELRIGFQGVRLNQSLTPKGWKSWVHRESPRKFESSILSLRILGLRIDRIVRITMKPCAEASNHQRH